MSTKDELVKSIKNGLYEWVESIGASINESIKGLGNIILFITNFFYWVF